MIAETASKTDTWTIAIVRTAGGVAGLFDAISAAFAFASVTTSACANDTPISSTAAMTSTKIVFIVDLLSLVLGG